MKAFLIGFFLTIGAYGISGALSTNDGPLMLVYIMMSGCVGALFWMVHGIWEAMS